MSVTNFRFARQGDVEGETVSPEEGLNMKRARNPGRTVYLQDERIQKAQFEAWLKRRSSDDEYRWMDTDTSPSVEYLRAYVEERIARRFGRRSRVIKYDRGAGPYHVRWIFGTPADEGNGYYVDAEVIAEEPRAYRDAFLALGYELEDDEYERLAEAPW